MKNFDTLFVLALALLVLTSPTRAAEHENLKAFPAAGEGMERFVIVLPHKERGEEDDFRVELIAGKVMETDGVNSYTLGGKIAAKPLKGWGFTYYEVAKVGPAISTRMAVPPGSPMVKKFVAMPPQLIRYNSRVPVVVYVPKGCEVHYRIWKAPKAHQNAEKSET